MPPGFASKSQGRSPKPPPGLGSFSSDRAGSRPRGGCAGGGWGERATLSRKGRGLDPNDPRAVSLIRKRVGACLFHLRVKGLARDVATAGPYKGWEKAGLMDGPLAFKDRLGSQPSASHREQIDTR